jgi:6-phosphofructokinase 1
MTFGFDSAVATVVDALDRLHTTAESHKRVIVLEVMGRHAGWIALYGGMAGGADVILLPEIPFHMEHVAKAVRARDARGLHSTLIVVAEGARMESGELVKKEATGEKGEDRLGGIGEYVAKSVEQLTGKETRACTLGHLQRGGAPTALDRILGIRFGTKAVHLIEQGKFGRMVSYQQYQVGDVSIEEAVNQLRLVTPDSEVVQSARSVGTCFGDC